MSLAVAETLKNWFALSIWPEAEGWKKGINGNATRDKPEKHKKKVVREQPPVKTNFSWKKCCNDQICQVLQN